MMYKKQLVLKGLVFSLFLTSIPMYSFASNINLQRNKYVEEVNNIETKEDLQKYSQKAVQTNEVDTWITGLASMPTSRAYLKSVVVNGKIYCIGGTESTGSASNSVEVYDPETDSWEIKTNMPTPRYSFASSVVDGKIYCIGGYSGYNLGLVEVYDPKTDSWETKTSMPMFRKGLTSAVVDGKIYCIGGYVNNNVSSVEVYDPKTDSWETKASMPTAREELTSVVVDGKIYCIGGRGSYGNLSLVEVYDPKTDSWETKTNMPSARAGLASAVIDGKIYCIGGHQSIYLDVVEAYNPITDTWENKTSMPTNRGYLAGSVVNGKIYCIGGLVPSYHSGKVEAYTVSIVQTEEEIAEEAVSKAEQSKDPTDIDNARDLVSQLPESPKKDELNNRLDALLPPTPQKISANVDAYIKMNNTLCLSLDTNSVTFEEFSGVEDMEKLNAVNLTVESSLPYELNASLEGEIQNTDKTETLDKSILGIRANGDVDYKSFVGINTYLILVDNQEAGKVNTHGIDLKLNKNVTYKADVYKTVIKFEVKQK